MEIKGDTIKIIADEEKIEIFLKRMRERGYYLEMDKIYHCA